MKETWNEPGCWLFPPPPPPGDRPEVEVEALRDVPVFMEGGRRKGGYAGSGDRPGRSKGIRDKVADWMGRRMQ
jgi:hypothetical protein